MSTFHFFSFGTSDTGEEIVMKETQPWYTITIPTKALAASKMYLIYTVTSSAKPLHPISNLYS